jgi:glutamyl-tRNA reductase
MEPLSPRDRTLVETMATAIVNKLVHGTLVTLKTEATSSSGAAFVEAARRFFNLDEEAVTLAAVSDDVQDAERQAGPESPSATSPAEGEQTAPERRRVGST